MRRAILSPLLPLFEGKKGTALLHSRIPASLAISNMVPTVCHKVFSSDFRHSLLANDSLHWHKRTEVI